MTKPLQCLTVFLLSCLALNSSVAQEQTRPEAAPGRTQLAAEPVEVPMKLEMNRPTVEVMINGKGPYRFVLDTGAGTNVLDPQLVEELGIESTGTTKIGDPSNPQAIDAESYELASISVGSVRFEDCPAVAWDAVTHLGVRGIIGLPTFYDTVVSMDYPNEQLTISNRFLGPDDGSLAYRAGRGGHITIDLRVADQVIMAHLDSGNMGGITIPLGMAEKLELGSEPKVIGQAMTAGGAFNIYSADFDGEVLLAGITMTPETLTFNDRFEWANVGYQAFAQNILTIDQVNRRIKLQESTPQRPSAKTQARPLGGQPRYGVMMGSISGNSMTVQQVIKGSIAESAGLRSGDKVLKVNGEEITELDPFGRMTDFRNSPLALTIERDGEQVEIEMKFPDKS